MKLLIAGLTMMLMSANAFAAKDVCKNFFACGTYRMSWKTEDGKSAVTTITTSATGQNAAKLTYMTSIDGGQPDGWDLDVQFEDNGSFKMFQSGYNYANGICSSMICTYGMHPWKPDGSEEPIGNAGMLRFNGDKLEYVLIYGTPVDNGKSLQIFTKP